VQRVLSWAAAHPGQVPRVAIYAHGGLNSEAEAIERARVLGPYFLGNGIFPIFTVWKTGIWETVGQQLEDQAAPEQARLATGVLSEARDRLIEALAHGPLRWAWRQMKDNAQRATQPGRGSALLAAAIARLRGFLPQAEVHLVGHSAGSFVAGHLLAQALAPKSLTLYAPACSLAFAQAHLVPNAPPGQTWLHLLSDKVERDDCVGKPWIYGKSLLYLVARGFEDVRKTPLAGLQHCLDPQAVEPDNDLWTADTFAQVQQWRAWIHALPAQADGKAACEVIESIQVDKDGKKLAATHGGFDNDVLTVTRTLNRMLGRKPTARLALPVEDLDY
jgi:pimeloyl-ACP methyl ester carboxylesterase